MEPLVQSVHPLSFPWATLDPFLFCVHHVDDYPVGDERMAPTREALAGRSIGNDFSRRDGWSMYHGDVVPGFPQHPHRGFETITIVRSGCIDHSDSLGATARFGPGDVQWLTAGSGIVHSEMFPLVKRDEANPLELFQIWLNLPARNKMVDPYFSMLWNEDVPVADIADSAGLKARVRLVSGSLAGLQGPLPPPSSWAADPEADFLLALIRLEPGAQFELPAAQERTNRSLYFFVGDQLQIAGAAVPAYSRAVLTPNQPALLVAGAEPAEVLLLQARPIGEPVVQHGPFVMNHPREIQQAIIDYQTTGFGGWPWPEDGPVHARGEGRFAKRPDGTVETPGGVPVGR